MQDNLKRKHINNHIDGKDNKRFQLGGNTRNTENISQKNKYNKLIFVIKYKWDKLKYFHGCMHSINAKWTMNSDMINPSTFTFRIEMKIHVKKL
jgi:hypothetical protein